MEITANVADSVRVGDEMVGYYVFDRSRAPGYGSDFFNLYYFDNAPEQLELHVSVGKLHIASFDLDVREFGTEIVVTDNAPTTFDRVEDNYKFSCYEARVTDALGMAAGFYFDLITWMNTDVISSTALPLLPPPIDKFSRNYFILKVGGEGHVEGSLTSLIRSP